MAKSEVSRELFVSKSGHAILIPHSSDGKLLISKAYSTGMGVIDNINYTITLNTVDINDGNSNFPATTFVQGQTGTVNLVMNTYDPELQGLINGADYAAASDIESDSTFWTIDWGTIENKEIPPATESESPTNEYRVALEHVPSSKSDLIINDSYGNKFTLIETGTPTNDNCLLVVDVDKKTAHLLFDASNENVSISVGYKYKSETPTKIVKYKEKPKLTNMTIILIDDYINKSQSDYFKYNAVFDKVSISGDVTPPTNSNDPTSNWTLTFSIGAPRKGNPPITVKMARQEEAAAIMQMLNASQSNIIK